jgi:hypothetical protein
MVVNISDPPFSELLFAPFQPLLERQFDDFIGKFDGTTISDSDRRELRR